MLKTTRRQVVLSASAAATLGLAGPLEFLSSALAADAREKGFVSFKVGDIECTSLYDGIWQKKHDDGFIRNASVDQTKAALTKAGMSPDFVPIEFAQMVLKTGGKTVLIDAGTGGQLAPSAGKTMKHMADAGIDAGAIDTVLISHFHPDHIFGLMAKETNEQIFPNAEIVVPEAEYKYWTDPGIMATLSDRRKGLAKRIQATIPTWKNVRQIGNDTEVAPGVRSASAFGHTAGHTAFHVASGDAQLMVAGDIANVPALFVANPMWEAVFDADPKMAADARIKLFDRAIADKSIVAGYHFGFPNAGTISKDGSGYVFEAAGA